jgi:hypothetical protein
MQQPLLGNNSVGTVPRKRENAQRVLALVRIDVSEKRSASFIRVTRIGELGTTLTSQRASVTSYT